MFADVWNASAVRGLAFFCYNSSAENIRSSNDKRVRACANDTLLPSHDLLEMLNLEDISNRGRLFANQWRE